MYLAGLTKANTNFSFTYDYNGNMLTDSRQYYFKDHLGSIRQVYDETATIVSAQDYYPYGEILRSYITGGNTNDKYKPACRTGRFTEKERDTETNYDYFSRRDGYARCEIL